MVTIQGQLDFKGGVYGDRHTRAYTASIINLFVCTYNAHAQIVVDAATFEGGVYWNKLTKICSEISMSGEIEEIW